MDKVKKVGRVEGAVPEVLKTLQFFFAVMKDEIMRSILHKLHQLRATVDDGSAVAPGKGSCEEPGDLNIQLFGEAVRDGDGISGNELRLVVLFDFLVEEVF